MVDAVPLACLDKVDENMDLFDQQFLYDSEEKNITAMTNGGRKKFILKRLKLWLGSLKPLCKYSSDMYYWFGVSFGRNLSMFTE